MKTSSRRKLGMMNNDGYMLDVISFVDDPTDLVRVGAVSPHWRVIVTEYGFSKRLFMKRFPNITHIAYEEHRRYHMIRLSDLSMGDAVGWEAREREHKAYSHLLQPRCKPMDCPRDCLLFPVDDLSNRSIAETILTSPTPVCRYPIGYSFLINEEKSPMTETRIDFLQCLELDTCIYIMSFLDDPADVARVSAVSRFWRQFVIANGLAKQSCLKVLPQLSTISEVIVGSRGESSSAQSENITASESEFLERDHTVYASLLHAVFTKSDVYRKDCTKCTFRASSTISSPSGRNRQPDNLIYKLKTGPWLVTDIDIRPFRVFSQNGSPISVRFKLGHPKSAIEISNDLQHLLFPLPDDKFVWTHASTEFPLSQPYELPEPALSVGGYVQIEILDRVHCRNHELFYYCMSHIKVVGRPLFPAFDVEIQEASGEVLLRYYPQLLSSIIQDSPMDEVSGYIDLKDQEMFFLPLF